MERILITDRGEPACEVLIGRGVSVSAADVIVSNEPARRVAILTQPAPAPAAYELAAALEASGHTPGVLTLPDREAAKTLDVAGDVYLWLNSLEMTRQDVLIAVGGGAATDLGGFVGATYLRGVHTVLIPTTLLGAVDAAIGGKSAVNVGGKNLAGTFRHPARVIVDLAVLEKLPRELLIEGTAEAVKAGFIADPGLIDLYAQHGLEAPIGDVTVRAIRVKAAVVSADFTEAGRRAILNYGHTVGHAIEHVSGVPHGHAVAIGMVAAGAASEMAAGFEHRERQRRLLIDLGLPVTAPPIDREAVEMAMRLDKKRDAAGLRMVLLEDFGKPTVATVDAATVRAALSSVGIT